MIQAAHMGAALQDWYKFEPFRRGEALPRPVQAVTNLQMPAHGTGNPSPTDIFGGTCKICRFLPAGGAEPRPYAVQTLF